MNHLSGFYTIFDFVIQRRSDVKPAQTEGDSLMAKAEMTKHLLAKTLKQLMADTPLDKISVQDIVSACDLNRKTFYYHFRDKQELVCWIFDTEFTGLHDLNHNNTIMDELVEHLYLNRDFYIAALTSDAQNNLREHLYQVGYRAVLNEVSQIPGNEKMDEKDKQLIAFFFSNAIIGCLAQWSREGMKKASYGNSINFIQLVKETLTLIISRKINDSGHNPQLRG